MPELAEVEYFRKQWNPGIGDTVEQVRTHPQARIYRDTSARALQVLKQTTLECSQAHGKQLCFQFSEGNYLGVHLGMTGKLLTAVPEIVPDRHDHLVLVMRKTALVFNDYRMFGKIVHFKGPEPPDWWRDLPPQPHEKGLDKERLKEVLQRHGKRPLKALLLDQRYFPGVGNWMADEILWRSRIHPAATGKRLSTHDRRRLLQAIRQVSQDALRVIGTDWNDPPDTWLFNHRWRKGGLCPSSGKPLAYEQIGGRTTCYSPVLQKLK